MDAQELTAALEKLCASEALSLDALRALTAPLVAAATRREKAPPSNKKSTGKKKGGGKKKKRRSSGDAVQSYKFFHEAVGNKGVTLEIVQHLLEVFPDAASKHCSAEYCLRCIDDYVDYDGWDSEVVRSGTYPLHLACFNNDCPGSVIKLLAEKYPEALKHRLELGLYSPDDLEEDTICDGGLPLHYYLSRISKASKWERDDGTEADKRGKSNVDPSVVKTLVDAFPRALEARNDNKEMPLHTVLRNQHIVPFPIDVVKYFIDKMDQSDLDAVDQCKRTPLHVACTNKNTSLDIIRMLLRCQPAALTHTDYRGFLPMHELCSEERLDESTCLDIAKCLIQESPECLQAESSDGRLPIHLASCNKSAMFCKLLVEAYPDSVRFKSVKDKELPIHVACNFDGTLETLKMLFDLHPEGIAAKTDSGFYPLHLAAYSSDKDASEKIAFLLSKDPGAASRPFCSKPYPSLFWDSDGRLPLHFACDQYEIDLASVKTLLQAYPEAISVEDSFGRTPLITADAQYCRKSSSEVVSFLKKHDPSAMMTYIGSDKCEACGTDDANGNLKTCEGCHLALYCSSSCQRKCWQAEHRKLCKHKSEMPPLHSSTLNLLSDITADFRARLQFALYELKHLKISIRMEHINDLDLASTDLWSFFHKKSWSLDSLTLDIGDGCEEYARKITGHGKVLAQIHRLTTLRLENVVFAAAPDLLNLLCQQRKTLAVLRIQRLAMRPADQEGSCPWSQREDQEEFVELWSGFAKLAKVELEDHHLDDAMLGRILHHLPKLKVLRLCCRRVKGVLTDSVCKSISQLGHLQALDLSGHVNVTVSAVKRILMNCPFMRELVFSGTISSLGELKSLLAIAPRLLYCGFGSDFSPDEIAGVVDAFGGRTLLHTNCLRRTNDILAILPKLSPASRFQCELNMKIFLEAGKKAEDPDVTSEWDM